MAIHGETTIVLKNVKTGLVERIHSENTFQSSYIANFLRTLGDNYSNNFPRVDSTDYYPLWKHVVGGLFLFKDGIADGAHYMPAGNVMIGAGVSNMTHSGAPNEWGSFNASESSAGLSAVTQVYDFTTDQANGQISCVCLTSRRGACIGYGHQGNTTLNNDRWDLIHNQETLYYGTSPNGFILPISGKEWEIHNSGINKGGTLKIRKRRWGITKTSIFDSFDKQITFDLTQIGTDVFQFSTHPNDTAAYNMYYIGSGKFAILVGGEITYQSSTRTVPVGGTIYWYEFDASAETLTQKTIINSTGLELAYSCSNGMTSCAFTQDGHILIPKYENFNTANMVYYKINYSTGVVTKIFNTIRFNGSYSAPAYYSRGQNLVPGLQLYNGGCGGTSTSNVYVYDSVNDTLKLINSNTSNMGEYFSELDVLQGCGHIESSTSNYKLSNNPLYLATINNLQSSVTKTAAQTMKVTYTLTEV